MDQESPSFLSVLLGLAERQDVMLISCDLNAFSLQATLSRVLLVVVKDDTGTVFWRSDLSC